MFHLIRCAPLYDPAGLVEGYYLVPLGLIASFEEMRVVEGGLSAPKHFDNSEKEYTDEDTNGATESEPHTKTLLLTSRASFVFDDPGTMGSIRELITFVASTSPGSNSRLSAGSKFGVS